MPHSHFAQSVIAGGLKSIRSIVNRQALEASQTPEMVTILMQAFTSRQDIGEYYEKKLINTTEFQFPLCQPNRLLFSFRNGIYDAEHNLWADWDEMEESDPEAAVCTANFIDQEIPEATIRLIDESRGTKHVTQTT